MAQPAFLEFGVIATKPSFFGNWHVLDLFVGAAKESAKKIMGAKIMVQEQVSIDQKITKRKTDQK